MPLHKNTIAVTILIVVLGAIGLSVWSGFESYHSFDGQCMTCHLTDPTEGAEKNLFVKDISALCVSCHKDDVRLSHPVDMKPSMKIPSDFLLDRKGNLTCNSCHTTHKVSYGKYHLRAASIGEPFCITCHQSLSEGAGLHRSTIGSAHMAGSVQNRYWPGSFGGYLDDVSIRCLICHDATFASESPIGKKVQGGEFDHGRDVGLSHPVGVSYRDATDKYKGAYKKIDKLPQEIRLFDGFVGCGSCHNPYGRRHFELVMSNEGSALCFACHNK